MVLWTVAVTFDKIYTASWSLIPGIEVQLLTKVGRLAIKMSRVFCCLIGKVTICERPSSKRISNNFIQRVDG